MAASSLDSPPSASADDAVAISTVVVHRVRFENLLSIHLQKVQHRTLVRAPLSALRSPGTPKRDDRAGRRLLPAPTTSVEASAVSLSSSQQLASFPSTRRILYGFAFYPGATSANQLVRTSSQVTRWLFVSGPLSSKSLSKNPKKGGRSSPNSVRQVRSPIFPNEKVSSTSARFCLVISPFLGHDTAGWSAESLKLSYLIFRCVFNKKYQPITFGGRSGAGCHGRATGTPGGQVRRTAASNFSPLPSSPLKRIARRM